MDPLPLKRGASLSLSKPISALLSTSYPNLSGETKASIISDLTTLDKLREQALHLTPCRDLLDSLQIYYTAINILANKFQIGDDGIKLAFTWYNSASSRKDKDHPTSSYDIRFEKAAVLFNIALCLFNMALTDLKRTDYKLALSQFSQATGLIDEIKNLLINGLLVPSQCDLNGNSLDSLHALCMALGQECFTLKAISDKSKNVLIARLSDATAQLYDQSQGSERMGVDSKLIQNKIIYYRVLACSKRAADALINGKYGDEITHLRNAMVNLEKIKQKEMSNELQSLYGVVNTNMKRALKDNDMIYNETVPNTVSTGSPAIMVKAQAFPINKDISLHSLMSLPEKQIQDRIVQEYHKRTTLIEQMKDGLKMLAEAEQITLQELGLPGALEAVETPTGIPDTLFLKAEQVKQLGGPQGLRQTTIAIEKSRLECESLFRQIQDALSNESNLDGSLRTAFSTRWNRQPSHQLNDGIRAQLASLRVVLSQAEAADTKVKADLTLNEPLIHKLVSPHIDLPEVPQMETSSSVREVRSLLDMLNSFISERNSSMEILLKPDTDASLLQHYLQNELPHLNSKSQELLSHLRQIAPTLHHTRQSHSACLAARQSALQDLDRAYQFFMQLHSHLDEGYSFYTSLISKMQSTQREAEDFAMSRRIEADELRENIQAEMDAELKKMTSFQQLPNIPTVTHAPSPLTSGGYSTQTSPYPQSPSSPSAPVVYPGQWNPSIPVNYANAPMQPSPPPQPHAATSSYHYPATQPGIAVAPTHAPPQYPSTSYSPPPMHPTPPQPYQQPPFSSQQHYGMQTPPPHYSSQSPNINQQQNK